MSVCHHDREPLESRLSESPRRTPRRPWRERRATSLRPRLELLEPRVVLSATIFTVNSTGNGTSGSGTSGTLPYVISQANANTNTAGSEIEFDSSVFASPQTVTLGATLVLSETAGPELIDGPAAGVTISGGGAVSVFEVESGVTATLSGVTISGGSTSGNGGGLYNNGGTVTLTNCTITGSAADIGGGVWNGDSGTVTLTGCTVSGNSAGNRGGGLYAAAPSTTTLTNCAVSGNSVPGVFGDGGGLAIDGTATLTGCTISGDSSDFDGGGVWIGGSGTVTMTDCTISGDSTSDTGDGGGVYNAGIATLTNCTVTANYAFTAGGLLNGSFGSTTVVTLENTIVAGNTGPPDNFSDIYNFSNISSSSSYNLIGNGGSGGLANGQNGNIVLTSLIGLGLAPLGNYGGPTQTVSLLPGSPAIGAGTIANGVTTDQRGDPIDSPPDIGAFQSQGFTLAVLTGATPQQTTDGTAFANRLARFSHRIIKHRMPFGT